MIKTKFRPPALRIEDAFIAPCLASRSVANGTAVAVHDLYLLRGFRTTNTCRVNPF